MGRETMKYVIWSLVAILLIVHQDNWFWTDDTLVFGFMPIGLMWHVGISISAAIVWYSATVVAWPSDLEYAEESQPEGEVK